MYKIEISERTLHFKQPAGTSRGVYTTRHSYYLTLTSDELPGVEGVGECATLPDLSCDAKPEYEMTLRQVCQMVEQMGRIPYDMIRAYPSITFGLETAFASFFDAAKKFLEIVPAEGASSSEMLKQKGVSVPAGMENLTELFDSPFGRERGKSPSTDWCGWKPTRRCWHGWRRSSGGFPLRETEDRCHRFFQGT